nr:serine/arginine repetitive matrix protein 1-like [Aegilops tauschii subsp. strangulata]
MSAASTSPGPIRALHVTPPSLSSNRRAPPRLLSPPTRAAARGARSQLAKPIQRRPAPARFLRRPRPSPSPEPRRRPFATRRRLPAAAWRRLVSPPPATPDPASTAPPPSRPTALRRRRAGSGRNSPSPTLSGEPRRLRSPAPCRSAAAAALGSLRGPAPVSAPTRTDPRPASSLTRFALTFREGIFHQVVV